MSGLYGAQNNIIFLFFFLLLFNPNICGGTKENAMFFYLILFLIAFGGFWGPAC